MAQYGIPINDMYAFVKNLIDMNKPASHSKGPFFFNREPIHPPLQDLLYKVLGVQVTNLPWS